MILLSLHPIWRDSHNSLVIRVATSKQDSRVTTCSHPTQRSRRLKAHFGNRLGLSALNMVCAKSGGAACSRLQPDPAGDTTAQTGHSARHRLRKIPPCRQFTLASDSIRSGSHADLTDAHIPRRNPSMFFVTVLEKCKDATTTDGDWGRIAYPYPARLFSHQSCH